MGGGPKHLYNLLEHLNQEKYKAYVAAPKDGEFFEKFSKYAEVIECDIKHGYLSNLRKLERFIKEKKIDIVHSHGRGAGVYSRPLKKLCKGIKVVHTFHGIHYENKNIIVCAGIKTVEPVLCKMTDMAICVSEQEREEAVNMHFAERNKSVVIYNGVDSENFQISLDVTEYRKQIGLTESDYVIGCVARLDKVKGHKELVEAFAKFVHVVPEAKLLLVGEGNQREEIENHIRQLKLSEKCILLGAREDIPQLLKCMDVFVLASHKEALGYAPIEALAAGIPVIVSEVQGLTEVIQDDYNGMLFQTKDAESLFRCLLRMQNCEYKQSLIENAKLIVGEKFSVREMNKRIEEVYEQLS